MKPNLSRLLLTVIIGVLRALQEQSISLNEAEQLVFSPATAKFAKKNAVDKTIIALLQKGIELEDILSLLPDSYLASISEIERAAHALLKSLPEYDFNSDKLIIKMFE